ncbi:MAG: hypothetical protein JWR69_4128 [Pedosphaera sp.]|nr:hypothetical protein [Pedosphaera sp.]
MVGLIAVTCLVFTRDRAHDNQVSFTFQRYSNDLDPYVGDVAFLWLTNASKKSYLLSMTGNSNTFVADTAFGRFKQSWMVNCEFDDQTTSGRSNWTQLPSLWRGSNSYLGLGPRSGIVVRVPLQRDGQHRKAAVLCEVPTTTSPFWAGGVGFQLLRVLPQSLRHKVIQPKPLLLPVWCDRELSFPGDKYIQK